MFKLWCKIFDHNWRGTGKSYVDSCNFAQDIIKCRNCGKEEII